MMVGDSLMYEPSMLESKVDKQDLDALDSYSVDVPIKGALGKQSMTQLKKHRLSKRCVSNLSSRQNIQDTQKRSALNEGSIEDQSVKLSQPDSMAATMVQLKAMARPMQKRAESSVCYRRKFEVDSVAPYKSVDGRKHIDDTPATTHKMSSTRIGDSTEDQLTNKHVWAKTYAMMPRTATNFHKMKKGLYLNSLKGTVYDL